MRSSIRLLFSLVAVVATGCSSPATGGGDDAGVMRLEGLDVPSPKWQEQIIYFVMTDRFADGDPSNNDQGKGEFAPTDQDKYSGGDLQGIIDHLDYIQGLGATAIWITPPVANMWWDPLQKSGGYHGYWARNLKKVDEHFGTLETYQKLSIELHKRGMYLIQDVVPNHMGNFFTYGAGYDATDVTKNFVRNTDSVPSGAKPEQAPFDQNDVTDPAQKAASIYHWTPAVTDYNSRDQMLNYQISDLDDLDSENPVVRAALRDSYGYWIKAVGVDAFRVDTGLYMPHDFLNDFFWGTDAASPGIMATAKTTSRDDFFAFGETFETPAPLDDAAEKDIATYLGTTDKPEFPAVLGFPLYTEIGRVFGNPRPTSYMTYRLGRFTDKTLFPDYFRTPIFIDNHDVARFRSSTTDAALAQALTFLFTVPGIPVVYYGTEQRFTQTRSAMFGGGYMGVSDHYDNTSPFYKRVQKLAALRKQYPSLSSGTLDVLYDNEAGPGVFAYSRSLNSEKVIVLFNTADEGVLVSNLSTKLIEGSVLEVLYSEGVTDPPIVGLMGFMTTILPKRTILVLHPTGSIKPGPNPGAVFNLTTPIEGRTFTTDVTFTGTVTPANTTVWMVLDGFYDRATVATVDQQGNFSAPLPVSGFPTGTARHSVAFYAPTAGASTPVQHFTTNVVFAGTPIVVDDPAADDQGPSGKYTYPKDQTFSHQNDIRGVHIEAGATTMAVKVTMAEWTSGWNPPNGYDHVAFNIFLSVPGKPSAMALPKINASMPGGGTFTHNMFSYGWGSPALYSASGSSATMYGGSEPGPTLSADATSKTVTFTFDRRLYGIDTWSGTSVYVTDWDFDGINAVLRPLTQDGAQWWYGGGGPPFDMTNCHSDTMPPTCESLDPKIMDDVPPILIP